MIGKIKDAKYSFALLSMSVFLLLMACSFRSSEDDCQKLKALYTSKLPTQSGDWLASHQENFISFEDYKSSNPTRAKDERNTIYYYSLGEFTKAEDSLLNTVRTYLSIVFHLPLKAGKKYAISSVPDSCKRDWGTTAQINTHFILDKMVDEPIPIDAAAALCFTSYDLYPSDDYNFVFGQAYLHQRAGIWSFYRYGYADRVEDYHQMLRRMLAVALHETSHMFSIKHCIRYECVMNGSNSLFESDRRPLFMCPDCLQKLSWNLDFDLREHFSALEHFFERNGFADEAAFAHKNWLALQ